MRFFFVFLFILFFHLPLTAGEHTVSTQISYNSEQSSASGYGLIYQYQLIESFEFEAKYLQSGDLQIINDDKIIDGDYHSFSSGINFTKLHHQNLTVKLGFGASLISSSSNNLLIDQDGIYPYFQIAASYKVTDNLSLTFGHSSQFNQAALGTNHSLFISLNWLFSSNARSYSKSLIQKNAIVSITNNKLAVAVIVQPKIISRLSESSKVHARAVSMWYVQIGAYQQADNAHHKALLLKNNHSLTFSVSFHNELYRVLSQTFSTKNAALEYLLYLENSFNIQGLVKKI
ncbi:MAG: SPOR domain-containing protein [Colwellia sp.]|nr:SPOR domain-containing protein [Colwellia sp.]